MEKDELEQRIKELEIELSLLKSGKVESPLLENESSFYNAGADPSEQKKVENVSKESEEKFKLIFEKSIAPIIVADDKGNYLEVNKAAAEIFEYSINELMGMNVSDLITTSNPNAAAQYEEYIKKGEEIGEFGFISKKGTPKILQYQAVRIKPDCNLSILMDVTSQKQIEDELLKTQERLNAGLKIANIALSEISYITNTVQLSPESAAMYGFPKNQLEATRQQMHDTFHPAIKAELETQIIIAMNPDSGGHMALEHPIVLPSGEVRWLKVNKQFFYDHSTQPAKPVYSILVSQDITEIKESSQYARSLIEASLDPLVTISADGKITDVNEASIKVTGVEREKLIGTDFSNYFTEPQKAQEGYQQVFEKGFVADYPLTIKHKHGKLTDVLYNASVYKDAKGNVLGVFAAARDVTEQKKASQYARSLIEASLDPLVTISADGKITDVNEASIKVTGVEREKLIGTDFSNYFTEPQKAQEGYQQVFEKGFVADYPLTIKHKNGKLTDVLYNASVYKDDKGNVLGVFAAARDVTERKMFEKEMIDAKVSAENAAKSKQQFLSNMSHEIRTPLNSILGFTNVLLKTELGLQQKEFVEAINTSGKSLNLLINDILDLAKVDAGKMTFEKHPIEIRKSISAILHSFDLKIKEKNLELAVEHDSKVPSILWCDSLRLNQIFFNLLSNAIKFTHKGKIKLTIKLLHEDKENVTIEFVVSDSGIGIADNKLNSIFNLFEQAEINTSTSYGGTGLGLSIVKQLVEGQGGSVSVKSKLGEGSAFSFILPFGIANLKLEEEIILLNPVSEIKNLRVLVAEDVALNQLLIKIILNDFGFEHEIVGNGKLAIEKMQTNTYDIILMDLHMPEMNGFEATEYIRKTLKSHIPIIALTADVTTMDVSKCKEFGMDSYISKPIEEKLLYNKIVELVKKNK